MEFLYRLYSNNYFGIGLFVVIVVLAFSFVTVLFFGKKDQKLRATNNSQNNVNNDTNKSTVNNDLEAISISIAGIQNTDGNSNGDSRNNNEQNNGNISLNNNLFDNVDINIENDKVIENSVNETVKPQEASVDQEEEKTLANFNIEDIFNSSPLIQEEPKKEINFEIPNKIKENINTTTLIQNEAESVLEPKTVAEIRRESNPQFSSVYLNEKKEQLVDTPDAKPSVELPKKIELPKLNKVSDNTSIFASDSLKEEKNTNNIFEN